MLLYDSTDEYRWALVSPQERSQMNEKPNERDPANPAIISLFQAEHQWRGVADPECWVAVTVAL